MFSPDYKERKNEPRNVTWVYIIPAYSGGIYFISQVIVHPKKKSSSQHSTAKMPAIKQMISAFVFLFNFIKAA